MFSTIFGCLGNIMNLGNMKALIRNRNIFHTILIICFGLVLSSDSNAQTDAMYTKYMFNSLSFNPAYAGSKEFMSINLIHRTQWLGIQGAPQTQTLTIHTPVKGFDRIAIGGTVINQRVGTSQALTANLSYAYRIKLGDSPYAGKIAVGMQGGITNWRANLSKVDVYDSADESFSESFPSFWLPNFGFGIYYYSDYIFLGVSSPNLLEYDLRDKNVTSDRNAKTFRHYYLTAGGAIPLKEGDIVFKPMILVKSAALLSKFKNEEDEYNNYASPTEFSFDLSVLFRETLWIGAAYRSSVEHFKGDSSFDSVDIWAAYYINKSFHIGLAYDYTLTKLQQPAKASFEVMLGYDFNLSKSKTYSPRYF